LRFNFVNIISWQFDFNRCRDDFFYESPKILLLSLYFLYSPFPYAYVDAICVIGKSVTCCGGGKEAYTHNFIVVYIFYMPIYIGIYSFPERVNVVNLRKRSNTNAQKPIRNWKRLFLFPPSRGPNGGCGGSELSNFRKFIKPRVVVVAAETYKNNNINIQLCVYVCVKRTYLKNLIFRLCCWPREAEGVSHRGGRGFMAFAHGTTTTVIYRDKLNHTLSAANYGPSGVGLSNGWVGERTSLYYIGAATYPHLYPCLENQRRIKNVV